MKLNQIQIVGDGSFGSFLKEVLKDHFEITGSAPTVVLAVPISAYDECGRKFCDRHLVNVCSVQEPSTDVLLRHTNLVTGLHPLFGRRTPADKRNSILTCRCEHTDGFVETFSKVSAIKTELNGEAFTPKSHDELMAKTHFVAVVAARRLKPFVESACDVPDDFIPNSFRLLREFVKTMEDMPPGTIESILENPYGVDEEE